MTENAKCAVECQPGQVRRELNELEETINVAVANLEELITRLSSVTRDEPVSGDDPAKTPDALVGLAEEIRGLRGRVRDMASRSQATISRLEL